MHTNEINDNHKSVLEGYCEYGRYQRQQYIRSVESSINDVIDMSLIEDTYTKDEVIELLSKVKSNVIDEVEAELIQIQKSNTLMLCQLFQQAEKWHLQLSIDTSEMQNKNLLHEIGSIENTITVEMKKPKLSPICTTDFEKTSEAMRLEIKSLEGEKTQLLIDIETFQKNLKQVMQEKCILLEELNEKNKIIKSLQEQMESVSSTNTVEQNNIRTETDQVLADYDVILKEQISEELERLKLKLKTAESQVALTEKELENKFNNTTTYRNMMQIIAKKNEQIRNLRSQLPDCETIGSIAHPDNVEE